MATEPDPAYVYHWNRMGRKGQHCSVLVRGSMNSCLVRFEDGFEAVTSEKCAQKGSNSDKGRD